MKAFHLPRKPGSEIAMNWFKRHLNWTFIIFYLLLVFIASIISVYDGFYSFACFIIGALVWLLSAWVLKQKMRRMWWLLILFIPLIGVLFIIALENRRPIVEREQEREKEILQDYYSHWKEIRPDILPEIEQCESHWYKLMEDGLSPVKADRKVKELHPGFFSKT
jgi:hypothetical protein